MQDEHAETPEQELTARQRRAEFLRRVREDTAKQLAAVAVELQERQLRLDSVRPYTLTKVAVEVRRGGHLRSARLLPWRTCAVALLQRRPPT